MKKLLLLFACLPVTAFAGTITTAYSSLGTITISSGTAEAESAGIVYDSSTAQGRIYEGASPLTWNMTIGSGSNRFLAVGCGGLGVNDVATGITVGGNAMTLSTSASESGTGVNTSIYTYVAPPSGSQSIAVTISGGYATNTKCVAVSWSGVAQTSPVEFSTATIYVAGGSYVKPVLVTSTANDMLFDTFSDANDEVPATTESGQGAIWVSDYTGYFVLGGSTRTTTATDSYLMGWTPAGAPFVSCAIAIKPAP